MSDDEKFIKLADATAGEFRFGARSHWRMRGDGSLRAETWRDRWASALAEVFWPQPAFVVTSIDRNAGTITIGDRK